MMLSFPEKSCRQPLWPSLIIDTAGYPFYTRQIRPADHLVKTGRFHYFTDRRRLITAVFHEQRALRRQPPPCPLRNSLQSRQAVAAISQCAQGLEEQVALPQMRVGRSNIRMIIQNPVNTPANRQANVPNTEQNIQGRDQSLSNR